VRIVQCFQRTASWGRPPCAPSHSQDKQQHAVASSHWSLGRFLGCSWKRREGRSRGLGQTLSCRLRSLRIGPIMASTVSSSPSILEYLKARGYSIGGRGLYQRCEPYHRGGCWAMSPGRMVDWIFCSSEGPKNRGVGGGVCGPVIGFTSDAAKIAKTDLSKKSTDSREQLLHHSRISPTTVQSLFQQKTLCWKV